MKNGYLIVIIFITAVVSYLYGLATINYRIFPFEYIKSYKESLGIKPVHTDYYYNKVDLFTQLNKHNYDFVFIGDSITDRVEWSDLLPAYRIANRGISKDTTEGLLQRMDSIYSTSADNAFIMIGINDFQLGASVDEVFKNYSRIVEGLIEEHMKVYIQSTIFAGNRKSYLNQDIKRLNNKLKYLSKSLPTVSYIELNNKLSPSGVLHDNFTADGIHLNALGYIQWKNVLMNHLAKN
jgi:lysophospholipase L1-like esterase